MTHYYCTLVRYHIPTSLCKAIISRNVFIFIKIPPKSACNQGNFIVCNCRGKAPCNFPFSSPATILRFKSQLRETFLENFFTYTTQYAKAALFKVTSSFQREVKKCVSTPICMDVIFKEWKWSRFWLKAAAKCEGRGDVNFFFEGEEHEFFRGVIHENSHGFLPSSHQVFMGNYNSWSHTSFAFPYAQNMWFWNNFYFLYL